MIDHVTLHATNYEQSKAFYEAALKPLGYAVAKEFPQFKACGFGIGGKPEFWMTEKPNVQGIHIAFNCTDKNLVDLFYDAAIAAGGKDNGPPGPRPQYHPGYYGAFVLDPSGHNVEAVCHDQA